MPVPDAVDRERQAQAARYARERRVVMIVDLLLTAAFLSILLISGVSAYIRDVLEGVTTSRPVLVALYFVVVGLTYTALGFPLAYYSGFSLPKRYGMSTQTARGWLADWLKELPISGVFGLLVVEVMYALLELLPDLWWLATGLVLLLFSVVLTHLAPVLLFPLFYRLTPLEESELTDRLTSMARRVGARVQGVFRIDLSRRTTAANAALVGLGSTRRIVLGDTLLERFTADEIESVFAHELGHHVNRDIGRLVVVQSLLTLGGLYVVDRLLVGGLAAFGLSSLADVAGFPLLALGLFGFGVVTTPLGNAFSRLVEREADRYALEAAKPEAFASAMRRLTDQNLAEYRPDRWIELLLYSHPAPFRRVAMAEEHLAKGGAG